MCDDAEQLIDPFVAAFNEHFDESAAEIKHGTITLQRAARDLAETFHLSVGSMEIQLSEAIGKPMTFPYCDYWDRPASYMTEICEQLELTLQAKLTTYLGGGKQGHVFADDEHKVVKITRSLQEALLARFLQSRSHDTFPTVHSVESHLVGDVPIFLIRRDPLLPLVDFISEEQPDLSPSLIKSAWADTRRKWSSPQLTYSLADLEAKSPRIRAHFETLARSLEAFQSETGLSVTDVYPENMGFVADQSRLVVMDFGMNDIESKLGYSILGSIPKRTYDAAPTLRR